jgi:hypothetical protein
MAPVDGRVPPAPTVVRHSTTAGCDQAACPAPQLRSLRVADDAVVATLEAGRHRCTTPGAVETPPLDRPLAPPAAAACDAVSHLELGAGVISLVADSVLSRTWVQGCAAPVGTASVGILRIAGIPVPEGTSAAPLTPNHTMVVPPGATGAAVLATVVLDEQIPDPDGRGLTVNAIHLRGGPALPATSGLDVVVGHTHSWVVCPHLLLHRDGVPGGWMTYAVVDPAVFPLDAGVVGEAAPSCFAGDRRGGGCMETIAAMVARHHALLGMTANYTDWIHVLGSAVVDHHAWAPVNLHTTDLCVAGESRPGLALVSVVKAADPHRCRAAVSGQLVVSARHANIEGLSDAGHHWSFYWSTRPPVAEPRAYAAVLGDGTVLIALATATRDGIEGGISQYDGVNWLINQGAVDAIEMDGGNQGDMVAAGGTHLVPLGDGVPRMQVALLIDAPGSEAPVER